MTFQGLSMIFSLFMIPRLLCFNHGIKLAVKRFHGKCEPILSVVRNSFIEVDGATLCYDLLDGPSSKEVPVVFLPSLTKEKNEAKSNNLQAWCRRNDHPFLCADYYGVGRSTGEFKDGTVGRWASDTIVLLEEVLGARTNRRAVLVGHGVGAWVSFIVAQRRPELVRGIVGIAADPDFTEELLWKKLPEEIKAKIMNDGIYNVKWGSETYPISKKLIEDGRNNLLLSGGPGSVKVACPVRLLHGLMDEEVSYEFSLRLAQKCSSEDVKLLLLKNSRHSMDTEVENNEMRAAVQDVIDSFQGDYDLRCPGSG